MICFKDINFYAVVVATIVYYFIRIYLGTLYFLAGSGNGRDRCVFEKPYQTPDMGNGRSVYINISFYTWNCDYF